MNAFSRIAPATPFSRATSSLRLFEAQNTERKWPIRYQMIEPLAVFADIAVILTASLVSDLAAAIGGDAINLGKAAGATMLVASLFVCLVKMQGLYRPPELLAFR